MIARRRALGHAQRTAMDRDICRYICAYPGFLNARIIALYMPIRSEVDLLCVWRNSDKTFLFPRVEENGLVFYPARDMHDFHKGRFGILEPEPRGFVDPESIGLMFVPGIVFDRQGFRIGYGKGFYDRFMTVYPDVITMGVCHDEFLVDRLDVEPWDTSVDSIVTPLGLFMTKGDVCRC